MEKENNVVRVASTGGHWVFGLGKADPNSNSQLSVEQTCPAYARREASIEATGTCLSTPSCCLPEMLWLDG